ncbi:MAG: M48 family metallopeptidase [Armatimonadetes bacterium]|nr:M48 family metallopeptidase [Armatimonadota bacterium]
MRSLREQIEANKRASFFFVFVMLLLLGGLGAGISGLYAPKYWPYAAGGAALLGLFSGLMARFFGAGMMLSIAGARECTHEEYQVLDNVVQEMAIAGGIPIPKAYVVDDPSPNAFATGMDPKHGVICVTTGLLRKLDRDELQGVIAHEMSHIRNYDIRFMSMVAVIAGLIPMLADFFRMSAWGGGRRRSDDGEGGGILIVIGIILAILAPMFAFLLQLAVSRKREYMADASGAQLTRNPEALARALVRLEEDPEPLINQNRGMQHMYIVNPLRVNLSSMLDTHPSTKDRVEALMHLRGMYSNLQQEVQRPGLPNLPTPPPQL